MKEKNMQYKSLYNQERKNMFLESYEDEGSRKSYEYVLEKCKGYEERFGKDLSDFNHKELDILLHGLNAKTIQSVSYQVSMIQNYIKFAIEEGFSNNNINYATLPNFSGKNLSQYVNNVWKEKQIMTKDDIYKDIINETENAQDGVIFALLFEGAGGQAMSEIVNLKKDDVDYENKKITLTDDDDNKRTIEVSESCIEIVKEAANQSEYFKTILDDEGKVFSEKYDLKDSEYVLRLIDRKDAKSKITKQATRQRFRKIKDYYKNPYLTPSSIRLSGMIHLAKTMMDKLHKDSVDELTIGNFKFINEQFGIDPSKYSNTKIKIKQHI